MNEPMKAGANYALRASPNAKEKDLSIPPQLKALRACDKQAGASSSSS